MGEKFEKILNEHGLYGEDPEEVIYAVRDMLELVLEETKEKEPYAINSINSLESAARQVYELTYELE